MTSPQAAVPVISLWAWARPRIREAITAATGEQPPGREQESPGDHGT